MFSLAFWLLPFGVALALLAGWVSHAWADMMTKGGVAWFWPARIRCVLPGNPDWRMELAKGGELTFLCIVALIGVLLMPLAETGKGTAGLIRGALGDLEMARKDYDQHKGDYRFSVTVTGRDNRDHADISGTYPVIGPWREGGLILATEDGARSLCTGSACHWYGSHTVLTRGERIMTSIAPLIAVDALREQADALSQVGEVFLLGTAEGEGVKAHPPTLEVTGDQVTFIYASPSVLQGLAGRRLRAVDLVFQVRHAPGRTLPALHAPAPVPTTPALLERWLPSTPPGTACTVNSIYDGDTLRATCGGEKVKIRLYCIDTPELAQRPWGQESRDYLRRIAPQTVSLREHDTDRYGRIVGEVFGHAGKSLNLALVEGGQAAVYPRYCKEARFYEAQDRAKAAGRGIWEKAGLQQTPWAYRAARR